MDSSTQAQDQAAATPGALIKPVLSDLQSVVANVTPDQFSSPTPCPDFTVEKLRWHILGWTDFFGHAFADPSGAAERPDPQTFDAPEEPAAAAAVVAEAATKIGAAIDSGIEEQSVKLVQGTMPGAGALTFVLWEALMHGHDLAVATGQSWHPRDAAAEAVLPFAGGMLTDDYRGPGKDFGEVIAVPDDAPALDRLLGFSGRDPNWTRPEN